MSVPEVVVTEADGQLGSLPDGATALAFLGVANAGPTATPTAFGSTKGLIAQHSGGPLVEASCTHIVKTGKPALVVRAAASVVATHTGIDITGVLGTCTPAIAAGDATPDDDYEPYVIVTTGGVVGTAGIFYQESLDGGRTLTPIKALGTALLLTIAGSGGIGYDLDTGMTLLAGDVIKSVATGPVWNSTDLGAALLALKNSTIPWEIVHVVGKLDATTFDALETAFAGMPDKVWVSNTRMPNVGESESTYKTALDTIFSAKATTHGLLCAGAAKTSSGVTFRSYRRPPSFAVASRLAMVSEEIDIAEIDLGALVGVSIRTAAGNPDEHDETVDPGLDASRFCVLRTHDNVQGVYVNNPRLFSAAGSDFEFAQHRRVTGLARRTLISYFVRRLSKSIIVSANTGFILESEAVEIETSANALMRSVLMTKPKVSGGGLLDTNGQKVFVVVSRTDNLLSTKTMNVQSALVPLAYPKTINIDQSFKNPALQLIQV